MQHGAARAAVAPTACSSRAPSLRAATGRGSIIRGSVPAPASAAVSNPRGGGGLCCGAAVLARRWCRHSTIGGAGAAGANLATSRSPPASIRAQAAADVIHGARPPDQTANRQDGHCKSPSRDQSRVGDKRSWKGWMGRTGSKVNRQPTEQPPFKSAYTAARLQNAACSQAGTSWAILISLGNRPLGQPL